MLVADGSGLNDLRATALADRTIDRAAIIESMPAILSKSVGGA